MYKLLLTLLAVLVLSSNAQADPHRVYAGAGWTHFSNIDAGIPFNNDPEDNADHLGVSIEYNYVLKNDNYWYVSLGAGYTKMNMVEGGSRWECGGCLLNSTFTLGYKWRIM